MSFTTLKITLVCPRDGIEVVQGPSHRWRHVGSGHCGKSPSAVTFLQYDTAKSLRAFVFKTHLQDNLDALATAFGFDPANAYTHTVTPAP